MKLEPFILEWKKVVAALLHGSLLQLTNSLGEDASIHAFCRPWFMFTAVADPSGSELAGVAAPRPSRGHCSIVVGDGLFWIRVMKLFGIQSFDPMATGT